MNTHELIGAGLLHKIPCRFRHFKGGMYTLVEYAIHTETRELLAIYKSDDGAGHARPYQMFIGVVEHDGKQVQRFSPVA